MKPDFQGLLDVLHAGERNPNLRMRRWVCGTAACLIGSFCAEHQNDRLKLLAYGKLGTAFPCLDGVHGMYPDEAIAERFGITVRESRFLFTAQHGAKDLFVFGGLFGGGWGKSAYAESLSGEEALNRLRKFLYYKMRKHELTYEEARHTGDIGINSVGEVTSDQLVLAEQGN